MEEEQGSYQQDLVATNSSQIINEGHDASETEGIKYILRQLRRGSYEEGVIATLFYQSFRVSEVVEDTN